MAVRTYTRISMDADGAGAGVERQLQDCQRYAADHGLTVDAQYSDNSISAYSGKRRPDWERLQADLQPGDTVLAYDATRLGRNAVDQLTFIEQCHQQGITVVTVSDGTVLTEPSQNLMTGIRALVAQEEARKIGERVSRQYRQQAESGRPIDGATRTFGYTKTWEIIPEEAEVIHEAFIRMSQGQAIYAITEWMRQTFPNHPVTGKTLKYHSVSFMLGNARYAGLNVFKGEVIGKGTQPAIITEALYNAANAKRRGKPSSSTPTTARKHLLTGVIHCNKCLAPLRAQPRKDRRSSSYVCTKISGGCGSNSMRMDWVDNAVIDALINHMGNAPTVNTKPDTDRAGELKDSITDAEQRISELQALAATGELPVADSLPMLKIVRAELAKLNTELAALETVAQAQTAPLIANALQFRAMEASQRRARIAQFINAVMLHPTEKPGGSIRKPNLYRIEVHWQAGTVENLGETDMEDREHTARLDG